MSRPHFNKKERERLFGLYKGECYLCGGSIDRVREAFDIEHQIPWEISYDNSDGNLRLAHVKCHKVKTAKDRKDIAKVHRIAAKHNGTAPPSRAKIQSRGFPKSRVWQPSGNEEAQDVVD